jgi:carbon storage regulator
MLVLSRRIGETIVVDGDIRITVVAVTGDKIRLGITAPDSVCVDREEVHNRRAEFLTRPRCSERAVPCREGAAEPVFLTAEVHP